MKYILKSKCKTNKLFYKIIWVTIILVVMFTFFLLKKFNENMNSNIENISKMEVERITYNFINTEITNEVLNDKTIKDILVLNKNKNGEILYVDFNLDKAYKVLDNISGILTTSFKDLENGIIGIGYYNEEMTKKTNSLILSIPMLSSLNNNYFYNLGPKIPVKINFIGSVLTNLKTKLTNYGLNNVLAEVFVYIEFTTEIFTPFNKEKVNLKYDAVIASIMIEGSVPSFYNGTIEKDSSIYSKNIE